MSNETIYKAKNLENKKIKYIQIAGQTPTGVKHKTLLWASGKTHEGLTQTFTPDIAYKNIEAWAAKYDLPPIQIIKTEDLQTGKVSLTETVIIEPSEYYHKLYQIWNAIYKFHAIMPEKLYLKTKPITQIYTNSQNMEINAKIGNHSPETETFDYEKEFNSRPPYTFEYVRQYQYNISRGAYIAYKHCKKVAEETKQPIEKFRDIIFARHTEMCEIAQTQNIKEIVVEYAECPNLVKGYFQKVNPQRKWEQIIPSAQEKFIEYMVELDSEEPEE